MRMTVVFALAALATSVFLRVLWRVGVHVMGGNEECAFRRH
jgi:hypothetical protein